MRGRIGVSSSRIHTLSVWIYGCCETALCRTHLRLALCGLRMVLLTVRFFQHSRMIPGPKEPRATDLGPED